MRKDTKLRLAEQRKFGFAPKSALALPPSVAYKSRRNFLTMQGSAMMLRSFNGFRRLPPASASMLLAMLALLPAALLAQNPLRTENPTATVQNPLRPTEANTPVTQDSPLAKRNELFQKAVQLASQEQLEAAIQSAQNALQIQRQQIGQETEDACMLLEQIAFWQERRADFASALATWQELDALSTTVRGADHWRSVVNRIVANSCQCAAQLKAADQQRLADAARLSVQSEQLFAAGKFADASDKAIASLKIRTELLGPDNVLTASSMHDVGVAYLGLGDSKSARPIFEQCVAVRERCFGINNPYTLASLANLSGVYSNLDEPKLAGPVLEKILTGSTGVYGAKDPKTVSALFELGNYYLEQNDLAQAEPTLKMTAMLQSANYQGKHLELAKTLGRLGMLYLKKPDYPPAEKCFRQSFEMYRQLSGEDDPQTANALVSLGVFEYVTKKYSDAEQHLQKAIDIFTQAQGENGSDTIDAEHWLARVLPSTGDYARAERLCRHVLQFYEKNLDKNDQRIAQLLLQMGVLYCSWNDLGSAEPCLKRAVEISRSTLGNQHPDTAAMMVLLATVDAKSGRLDQAQQHCQEALGVMQQALGPNHPQTAAASLALGNIYILQEKFDEAEQQLQQLLATQPNNSVDDRYHNAIILEKLANVALQRGDYSQAVSRAQRVTEIYNETLSELHPHQAEALLIGGIANHALHQDAEAKRLADKALEVARCQLDTTAIAQFERQQLALNYRLRNILDLHLSLPTEQVTASETYSHVLLWKGAIQARQIRDRQNRQPDAAPRVAELQQVCSRLATLSFQVPDPAERLAWLNEVDELKKRKETLEADLAYRSHDFRAQQETAAVTAEKIQAVLPADIALIDVLEYVAFAGGHDKLTPDETRYVAFVVRHGRPIVRIELGSAQPINDAVDRWRRDCLFQAKNTEGDPCSQLRELVWKPLEPYLSGCHTILFSPDAGLARFPFSVLPGKKPGSYLIEDVAIGILPVPKMLPEMLASKIDTELNQPKQNQSKSPPSLLIVGNIDYDAPSGPSTGNHRDQLSKDNAGGELLTFDRLKSAPAEIHTLRSMYYQQFPLGKLQVLENAEATETAFCREAPEYNWLFVATHGFYAPPNVTSALAVQDEMVGLDANHGGSHSGALSGLALAGANLPVQPGSDDGILTAYEVATLDLRGIELAVLSGCETGLGENALGEGVMGLQRAFQTAGAHTTVASLWSVPDQKTSQLMQRFYRNLWGKKMSKLEALREAQLSLIHEKDNSNSANNDAATTSDRLAPYYWAAFALSGDWR